MSKASETTSYRYYISSNDTNSYVLMKDGSAFYSAGSNGNGKLGAGLNVNSSKIPVKGIGSDYKMVNAGGEFTVLLKNDGTIWSFGYSSHGELGTGEKTDVKREPYKNNFINDVREVSAGRYFTLALKNDGTVWAYGKNSKGQLGIGSTEDSLIPKQVLGLENIVKIDSSEFNGAALDSDGYLWVWGEGAFGQLGQGNKINQTSPVLYPVYNVKDFSIGDTGINVVDQDGDVFTSGLNTSAQLGIGNTSPTTVLEPVMVNISDVKQISRGKTHTLALKEDGSVWGWGINNYGQIGDGTTTNAKFPVQVLGPDYSPLSNVSYVHAESHSMAIKSDGSILAWGRGENGELGINSTSTIKVPVETLFPNILN